MTTIYTDGAARGNPGPGGWAAIILGENEVRELGGHSEHATNNQMELQGVIEALKFVSKLSAESYKLEATIYTDSEYVLKGITVWVYNWQRNNWRTAAKKAVLNQELWKELLELIQGKDITWRIVPGHSGIKLNERCDEIATMCADKEEINLYHGPRSSYTYER